MAAASACVGISGVQSALSSRRSGFAASSARVPRAAGPAAAPVRRDMVVVAGKGKGSGNRTRGSSRPGGQSTIDEYMPPIDPDNEQFVIFVRSTAGMKSWYPLNVVTGGTTANALVKGLDNNLSKDMALSSLTNNIGQAIYKDQENLEKVVRNMPMMKQAKELQYGFMVLDKENPKGMFTPDPKAVIVIPPEEETRMPAQKAAEGVKGALDSVKNIISGNK